MIKLCIDARMAFSSGIGTVIRQLIPHINQSPFQLTLLVNRSWDHGCDEIRFDAPIYSIKEQLLFPLKVPKCDLFWSPHYNVPLLPIRAAKKIVTIHDAYHLVLGSTVEKLYAKMMMRKGLLFDAVTTVSEFSKNEIRRLLGPRFLKVIPIAVNKLQFRKTSGNIRKKYGLPNRFILFVGNLKPHKNLDRLIRAFSKVSLSDVGLVLVGKGSIKREEKVLPVGEVPDEDLPGFYSLAEAFIFPSFYEGFGLPPLEAMSCDCPTLVSNAASIPEVCGDASYYFDPKSEESMTFAIESVLSNEELKKALVEKGRKRIQAFNWEETGRQYRELFKEVVLA